jgi:hypothetical protein
VYFISFNEPGASYGLNLESAVHECCARVRLVCAVWAVCGTSRKLRAFAYEGRVVIMLKE